MNIRFKFNWISILVLAMLFVYCQPQPYGLEEFDINLPKSEITGFSPKTGLIGSEVTLNGINLDNKGLKVYIGSVECTVLEQSANTVKIKLPRVFETSTFTTINSYSARAVSEERFVPIYPETKVNIEAMRDTIFKAVAYVVTGENLDMVTEVILSDTIINIDGSTVKDPAKLTFSAKESNPLKPKLKNVENIAFKSRAGNEIGVKRNVVVMDNYPVANLLAVDPKIAKTGDNVIFIFDNFRHAALINQIKVGNAVASFSLNEPYVVVTIPEDAVNGAIEVKNAYGVTLKYANELFLTLN